VNIVETLSGFGWAFACYLAVAGFYLAVIPAAVIGLAGAVTAWFVGRSRAGAS
jgi:hypothetical protein